MPKNCFAVGCSNVFRKGSGIQFYCFPVDFERWSKWIAAVNRQNWNPTEYTWICSKHFLSGVKSNNPLTPNYVPSLFKHTKSPVRRLEARSKDFARRQATNRRRAEESQRFEKVNEERERLRQQEIEEQRKTDEVSSLQPSSICMNNGL